MKCKTIEVPLNHSPLCFELVEAFIRPIVDDMRKAEREECQARNEGIEDGNQSRTSTKEKGQDLGTCWKVNVDNLRARSCSGRRGEVVPQGRGSRVFKEASIFDCQVAHDDNFGIDMRACGQELAVSAYKMESEAGRLSIQIRFTSSRRLTC